MFSLSKNKKKMLQLGCFAASMVMVYNLILPVFEDKSTESLSGEYESFDADTFDVCFFGSSVMLNGVYPLQLYADNGIASYNLGCGSQTLPLTYYLVKETLRKHPLKLVVIDVYNVGFEEIMGYEGHTHYVTDKLKAPEKIECIMDIIPWEKKADFIFELATYHTRWEFLSKEDFKKNITGRSGTYGAKVWYGSFPFEQFGQITYAKMPLPIVPESYLRKTIELCQKKNVEVLLTLMPLDYSAVVNNGEINRAEWQKYWNQIQDIADEYDINYLNFMYHYDELNLNLEDSMDGGTHLNAHGAEKLTRYLGNYIKEHYDIPDVRQDPAYDFMREDYEEFQAYKTELELKSTTNLADYLRLLAEYKSPRYNIVISVKDIQGYSLTQDIVNGLADLGFEGGGILLDRNYHSFVGVVNGLDVVEKYGGDEEISYDGEINGRKFHVLSATLNQGNCSEIIIGSKNYSKNQRGLNIVLYDNLKEEIIDSVSFDTHIPEFTCTR